MKEVECLRGGKKIINKKMKTLNDLSVAGDEYFCQLRFF